MKKLKLFVAVLFLLFAGCKTEPQKSKPENTQALPNTYAELFDISEQDSFKFIRVYDKNYQLIDSLKVGTAKVRKPPQGKFITQKPKIVCLSTVHLAYLEFVGAEDYLIGVSGGKYVYNPKIKARIDSGELKEVGYPGALNFELLINMKPDLVTVYSADAAGRQSIELLKRYNIPYLIINEFQERHILGQTEWVRVFSRLYGNEKSVNERLEQIFSEYEKRSALTAEINNRPTVMLNMPWNGTWYVPGGKSNTARLIHDAGGNYIFASDSSMHNRPLSPEAVTAKAVEADLWLNPGQAESLDDIVSTDKRLKLCKPFKSRKVYNRIRRLSASGANDYMESGIMRPDVILKDLQRIMHPELFETEETRNKQLYFYEKLE